MNFSVKNSNLYQNDIFPHVQPILAAIFVFIATVKVKLIPDHCTLAIGLTKQIEEIGERHFLFFGLVGGGVGAGQNRPLMHVHVALFF